MQLFTLLTVVVFAMVALVHSWRLVYGWEATINGAAVPMWASVLAPIVAGVLAAGLWWESRR